MPSQDISVLIGSEILDLYKDAPRSVRLHISMRWRLFPFSELAKFILSKGTIVDLGCGHGLWAFYVALSNPKIHVLGIDPDEERIDLANRIARSNGISNVAFEHGHAERVTIPECNLISLVDVIYLIKPKDQERLLRRVVEKIQPKGFLLLKEMSQKPHWKWLWNGLEETVATRFLKMTYGEGLHFRPEDAWIDLLESFGLNVRVVRLDKGYLHPHILFMGEKP